MGKALTDNPSSNDQVKPKTGSVFSLALLRPISHLTALLPISLPSSLPHAARLQQEEQWEHTRGVPHLPARPALPAPLPQPRAANYLETHIWLRAGGNSKAVKLEKKSLWSVCDLRVPKGSFRRIISPEKVFAGKGMSLTLG